MNTAASSSSSGISVAAWNIICAIGFLACCVGGIIYGITVAKATGHWGMIGLAACIGAIGVIGIIRQAVFSAQALDDGIIFLVNFTMDSLPWTLAILGLLGLGIALFFISPPFGR